ncbi:MAG TPA: type III-A CRISPR-associated protein Csm2 [bacterium]|jgi:CRISPR-associated protein Csm2|nr:type III-A CRISPR-associated protein Csm2 [bacterium]HQB09454.1 type III-A CRISPR-associated protein Csm2 [bacterium]
MEKKVFNNPNQGRNFQGQPQGYQNRQGGYQQREYLSYEGLKKDDVENFIKNGPTIDLVNLAENTGKYIAKTGLTTSQIRSVFTKLKEIDAKGIVDKQADFIMLKPLVAYAAKRHGKEGLNKFKSEIINPGVDYVVSSNEGNIEKRFKNFVKLLEAVLAYHKAHGGN